MGRYVNPTADAFRAVLNYRNYVDKTELIAYTNSVLDTPDMLIASTRPRRFGKTFAAKMLTAYYSKGADARALFDNLKIAELDGIRKQAAIENGTPDEWESARFEEHLNRHDVICIDITAFISKEDDIRNTVKNISKAIIQELREEYPGCVKDETKTLASALMDIKMKTGNRFYIIIDEWDALFREAKDDEKLQKSYIQLLRSLFKTIETPQMIVGAYMTGILPIKKYGTQSALTDFREYTMLTPGPLAPFIGFTEEEVKRLCRTYSLDFSETQKWYDGYRFSKIVPDAGESRERKIQCDHVYCPNSIMELVARGVYDSYWTETETYVSLRDYIDMNFDGLKDALIEMLGGKHCVINTRKFQNDMTSVNSKDDVFTLLVHLGYLAYDAVSREVFMPNEEVRGEFINAVSESCRPELAKAVKISDRLLDATIRGDEETVAEIIQSVHMDETVPLHYNDEQALRTVVTTAYLSARDHYIRFEELSGGRGYIDILFLPRKTSSKPALLIELKWDKSVEKAVTQIQEKNYMQAVEKFGYYGRLLLVGINYSTKTGVHTCRIEEYKK